MNNIPPFIMQYLSEWGVITRKSMFGTYRLFCDGACFAMYTQKIFYLRAGTDDAAKFKLMGIRPYLHVRKSNTLITNFYPLPDSWWQDSRLLHIEVSKSIKQAKIDHLKSQSSKLRQLPNLNTRKEKLLCSVGITTQEKLLNFDAVSAFWLVKQKHSSVADSFILDLEGAITSRLKETICEERQFELRSRLAILEQEQNLRAG